MKHCVFCCSNEYKQSIDKAKNVKDMLSLVWMLEHDCIMMSYHSKFSVNEDGFNTEIYLENDNVTTLINDAMAFARELENLKVRADV